MNVEVVDIVRCCVTILGEELDIPWMWLESLS